MDAALPGCPVGYYVYYYSANLDKLKAMFATVLAAQLSGKKIFLDNSPYINCYLGIIRLLN